MEPVPRKAFDYRKRQVPTVKSLYLRITVYMTIIFRYLPNLEALDFNLHEHVRDAFNGVLRVQGAELWALRESNLPIIRTMAIFKTVDQGWDANEIMALLDNFPSTECLCLQGSMHARPISKGYSPYRRHLRQLFLTDERWIGITPSYMLQHRLTPYEPRLGVAAHGKGGPLHFPPAIWRPTAEPIPTRYEFAIPDDAVAYIRCGDLDADGGNVFLNYCEMVMDHCWVKECAVIEDFLRSVVPGPAVWSALKRMGWDSEARNPKKTFDKLTDYFTKGTDQDEILLHQQFVNIRRANFDRLEDYLMRVNYLRCRLNSTDFKLNDKAYVLLTLQGIATEYPDLYEKYAKELKSLKWESLMRKLYIVAVREDARTRIDQEQDIKPNIH
ncbi:uncharacterized protein B0T15DRAFT_554063 [Chaetomium strumarium]|uniref:Uncharacterized protein n=1 Tax=Chaetomium strumarium TaxID=1170767 RepID=A0AAJ0M3A2_9PEZI|nr:hypothetical protein B0T15DRAFT_554063 [Chaetomium strumarium]